jgi:hypothetical protein
MKKIILLLMLIGLGLASMGAQAQDSSPWRAWIYLASAHRLALVEPSGLILEMTAPQPANESLYPQRHLGFSRDGRVLVMATQSQDESPLIVMRDLYSNIETFWQGQPNEQTLYSFFGQHTLPTQHISPDGTLLAVGLGNPELGTWRVVLLSIPSAQPLLELTQANFEAQNILTSQPQAQAGALIPVIRWFDAVQIHFQVVPSMTEGQSTYPSMVWSAGDNRVSPSAYPYLLMDIQAANGQLLYAYRDANRPSAQPMGPLPTLNALGGPQGLLALEEKQLIQSVAWVGGGAALAYQTLNPETFESRWTLLRLDGTGQQIAFLPEYTGFVGTPDGFLSLNLSNNTWYAHSLAAVTTPTPLLTLTPGEVSEAVWVQPTGYLYQGIGR